MTSRRKHVFALCAAFLFAFCLPVVSSAQNNPWYRQDDRDYRNDRDYRRDRRDRRDDDYYGRNDRYGRYNNYDRRAVRDLAHRIKDNSKDFEKRVDHYLDHSRYDGSRREDRINELVKDFRRSADNFKDRVGDGRNLDRSSGEARNLLQLGTRIDRFMSRNDVDSRTWSDWSRITQDLRTLSDFYGYRGDYNGNDDYNNRRGSYDPRRQNGNSPWWLPRY